MTLRDLVLLAWTADLRPWADMVLLGAGLGAVGGALLLTVLFVRKLYRRH